MEAGTKGLLWTALLTWQACTGLGYCLWPVSAVNLPVFELGVT